MPKGSRTDELWRPVFEALAQLRSRWPTRGWSWDSKMGCVASSFSAEFEGDARAAAALALPDEWTASGLAKAPPHMRDLAERYGGVRSGQRLLTLGPVAGLTAFGLWWPWGNGQTISLRVGLADIDVSSAACTRLREIFGALD